MLRVGLYVSTLPRQADKLRLSRRQARPLYILCPRGGAQLVGDDADLTVLGQLVLEVLGRTRHEHHILHHHTTKKQSHPSTRRIPPSTAWHCVVKWVLDLSVYLGDEELPGEPLDGDGREGRLHTEQRALDARVHGVERRHVLGEARGRRVVTVEAVHDQQALRVLVVLHHHSHGVRRPFKARGKGHRGIERGTWRGGGIRTVT